MKHAQSGIQLASGYVAQLPKSIHLDAVPEWNEFHGGIVAGYDPVSRTGLVYLAACDRWQLMQPIPRAEFEQAIRVATEGAASC